VQRLLPRGAKIGHTGTLDPLATGVLVLCLGRATKLADRVQALPKEYLSTFRFGATSTTDDAEGELTPVPFHQELTPEFVREHIHKLTGWIDQTPPAFSAIKVNGRRAYAIARTGEDVQLNARKVRVDEIQLLTFTPTEIQVRVACGKGTYIRSLARDLGKALGTAGYVLELRRTRVGPFVPEMATENPLANIIPINAVPGLENQKA
jgi:tRNA pseudouridine55 synthase